MIMNKVKKAIIIFVYIFVCISAAEIMLRIAGYNYLPLTLKAPEEFVKGLGRTDWRFFHAHDDKSCVYDKQLIWRPRKSYGVFNGQGFRGDELNDIKQPNEYRIFVVGDSNSAGPRGADRLGWPDHLQMLFRKNNPDIVVTNASCWGYSAYQGLVRLKEILKCKPDLVLISFGANDAHRVKISDSDYARKNSLISSNMFKFRLIQLGVAVRDAVLAKRSPALTPRVSLPDYRKNIEEIISLSKTNNFKVILLTRPFIGASHHPLACKTFNPIYNDFSREIAYENNIGFIDLYSEFRDKEEYFADEYHFTSEGFELAAEFIYDYLTKEMNHDS